MSEEVDRWFDELKEWSIRKHHVLTKYVDGAARILGDTVYVDGFAGRGSYGREGEPQTPGSPVLIAEYAELIESEHRGYSLECINIEIEPRIYSGLERATLPYSAHVTNILGSFADNVDRIIQIAAGRSVVCFLDPFGINGLDWTAVERMIRRDGITDFWIRIDAGEILRREGYYDKTIVGSEKQFEVPMRLYGITDREELHEMLSDQIDRKATAVQEYVDRLRQAIEAAKGEGYAASYRIGSIENEVKYYLVFGSRDPKGINLASSIVSTVEEDYQRDLMWYQENKNTETGQISMFEALDPSQQEIDNQKVTSVAEYIWEKNAGKTISRRDVHASIHDKFFGLIRVKHLTAALQHLRSSGLITNVSGSTIGNDTAILTFRTP